MICNLCEEKEAKYVIRNIRNNHKLNVCTSCREMLDKSDPSEEVKT
jgi:protein-arginine kinase activator protein McsA